MRTLHESKVPPANRRAPIHKKLGRCPRIIDLPTGENKEPPACRASRRPNSRRLEQLRGILRAPGMPAVGDHIEFDGFRFEVVDMDGPKIDKVLAVRLNGSLVESGDPSGC